MSEVVDTSVVLLVVSSAVPLFIEYSFSVAVISGVVVISVSMTAAIVVVSMTTDVSSFCVVSDEIDAEAVVIVVSEFSIAVNCLVICPLVLLIIVLSVDIVVVSVAGDVSSFSVTSGKVDTELLVVIVS